MAAREQADDENDPGASEEQAAFGFAAGLFFERVDPGNDLLQVVGFEPEMAGEFAAAPAHGFEGEEGVIAGQRAELLFGFVEDVLADEQVDEVEAAGVFVGVAAAGVDDEDVAGLELMARALVTWTPWPDRTMAISINSWRWERMSCWMGWR